MKGYLDRLNLRPFEKRLVVVVAVLLFVVLNVAFVYPHFGDWARAQGRMARARQKLSDYQVEIAQMTNYDSQIKKMEGESQAVPREEQATEFSRAYTMQAAQSRVNVTQTGKITTKTNQFFLEQSQPISVSSGEEQLVDFLFNLGSGASLIRIRDLTVRPELPARMQLGAQVTLVASYQKKIATKPASTGKAPGAKSPGQTARPVPAKKAPSTPATSTAKKP